MGNKYFLEYGQICERVKGEFPKVLGQSEVVDRLNILETEKAKLTEDVKEFQRAFIARYPVAFVGEPNAKDEKLYLAYHKVREILEGEK